MIYLKQSTAVTLQFGPFVDATDGVTLETGLATAMDNATTGIRLSKNGAVFADRGDATVPAYDAMGCYRITLSTTDTNTVGALRMIFEEAATTVPVWADFMVLPAATYDALVTNGLNDITTAEVNTEVDNALAVTTYTEPAQGAPGVNVSLKDKIGWLYKFLRNKKTATSTTISLFNDDASTVDSKRTISDDGTTYTEGEVATGP